MLTGHEVIIKRNIFYRKFYRIQFVTSLLLILGIFLNFYIYKIFSSEKQSPVYFRTDQQGLIIKDRPLNQPIYSDQEIIAWTQNSLNKIYSINFKDYQHQLKNAQPLFTPLGFNDYIQKLQDSKNIAAIVANKYTVVTEFSNPLKVTNKTLINFNGENKFHWILEGRARQFYLSSENLERPFYQDLEITVLVGRESFYLYENGVGIAIIIGKSLQK